jgi:D-alanyl-lipoteichoic acid acyltransferase DltB (MBOAT superfamily)
VLFNSLQFVGFFAVVYALYLASDRKNQNRLLLVASYVFYGAWDYRFLSLLLLTTVVDFLLAPRIAASETLLKRRLYLACSIVFNLTILGFFKYFNFFAESFAQFASSFGWSPSYTTLNIVLPVGISFYTFQEMSYSIDVYRKRVEPCRNLVDFALFVSFFPQLVAGPIERAGHLIPQIQSERRVTIRHLAHGYFLILWGLFKKVVIADNLGITVDEIFAKQGGFASNEVLIGVLFFAFQIYCDFSGYSDIARGIAKWMGFDLMVNFNLPYLARNPSDFWRRWHISLSTWLRAYLYIPLGGNRGGQLRTYRNLMLTMLLGGLWHGAAWNFVLWGAYQGGLLALHRGYRDWVLRRTGAEPAESRGAGKWLAIGAMFLCTLYGWLLFRAESLGQIATMTSALPNVALDGFLLHHVAKLVYYAWPLFLMQAFQYSYGDLRVLMRAPVAVQAACYATMAVLFLVLGQYSGTSFIYFQF